jgi:hypothetical protein
MDSGTNKVECDSLGAVVPLRICETEDDGCTLKAEGDPVRRNESMLGL